MFNSSSCKNAELLASSQMIYDCFRHNREEMIRLADNHIQAVQTWLSTRTPNAKRFLGKGVIANSSGLPVPLLNLAFGTDYAPGTSDELIEREIESVKTFYRYQSVPWSWWIAPNATPSDMIQRLKRHELVCNFRRPVMIAPLPVHSHSYESDIHISEAATIADLEIASTIRHRSFGFPEGVAEHYFETMAQNWLNCTRGTLYMAGLAGEAPSAIGALITGAGLSGVYMMATLPERRRYGLGSAILKHILREATKEQYKFIVLTASPLGYPLYRKYGFVHVFDYLGFGEANGRLKKPIERRQRAKSDYLGADRRSTIMVNKSDRVHQAHQVHPTHQVHHAAMPAYALNGFR